MKYQLVIYDTWGNAEDGFDVNDIYRYDVFYEITDDMTGDDVVNLLKTEEKQFPSPVSIGAYSTATLLLPDADVEADMTDENFIEFYDAQTGEPLGRLEAVR